MKTRSSSVCATLIGLAMAACGGRESGEEGATTSVVGGERLAPEFPAVALGAAGTCGDLDRDRSARAAKATHYATYDLDGHLLSEGALRGDYVVQERPDNAGYWIVYLQDPAATGCARDTYKMCDGTCAPSDTPSPRRLQAPGAPFPGCNPTLYVHTKDVVVPAHIVGGHCKNQPGLVAAIENNVGTNSQINDLTGLERDEWGTPNCVRHLVKLSNGKIRPLGLRQSFTNASGEAIATTIIRAAWCGPH